MSVLKIAELGLLPDFAIRLGVRKLSQQRLLENHMSLESYVQMIKTSPLVVHSQDANVQHYELPPEFFALCLGKRRKYSCCHWTSETRNLDQAEENALELFCQNAKLKDGLKLLELGCGWGALSLWMAEKYRNAQITSVSNSAPQRKYIESQIAQKGLKNLRVITADIATFDTKEVFDRVVSIEMFEHVRNYQILFQRISGWLNQEGHLFFHVFLHRKWAYLFETEGEDNWMGRYFFTGGQMPSFDLFEHFQGHLTLKHKSFYDGTHYQKTSDAWLSNLDKNRSEALNILSKHYGRDAKIWLQRWRMFYLAVAECFGLSHGTEWGVGHFLMGKK